MPITFTRVVGPNGNDVFFSDGMAKVIYRVVGDGVGGSVNLPFHKLESVISVNCDQQYNPTINNTTKVVQITVPAQIATTPPVPSPLANGAFTTVELIGKGGH
jgi:hypothetical protein